MINKSYSIFCDECTRTEHLVSGTQKACEDESRNMGWHKEGKHWYCPKCHLNKVQAEANSTESL